MFDLERATLSFSVRLVLLYLKFYFFLLLTSITFLNCVLSSIVIAVDFLTARCRNAHFIDLDFLITGDSPITNNSRAQLMRGGKKVYL